MMKKIYTSPSLRTICFDLASLINDSGGDVHQGDGPKDPSEFQTRSNNTFEFEWE